MQTNVRTIIVEAGQWSHEQPWKDKAAPDYGMIEEWGELHHAILKNIQGIRGMDDPEKFGAAVKDAFGDMMVYLSHWCFIKHCYYNTTEIQKIETPEDFRTPDIQIAVILSRILSLGHGWGAGDDPLLCTQVASQLVRALQRAAKYLGYDLFNDCLFPTWEKVKQRNWNKDKLTGGDSDAAVKAAMEARGYKE